MRRLIGICGGIGSGKSVVSRLLRLKGQTVYDCDYEARILMESDAEIKCRIRDEISADVTDGEKAPDRRLLAEIVFSDEQARLTLNSIVHGAVRADLIRKAAAFAGDRFFVESALLAESGIADLCDAVWRVEADTDVRLAAIMRRDGCDLRQARMRIRSQEAERMAIDRYSDRLSVIYNLDDNSLLRQIDNLLKY